MKLYHGTSHTTAILADGFNLEARRTMDPGDFGWGVYLTDSPSRARAHGDVLVVEVDTDKLAFIASPYFLDGMAERKPETDVEKLFHGLAFRDGRMLLVTGSRDERETAARQIRDAFIEAGYDGIISAPDTMDQREVCVFRVEAITSVEDAVPG